jgi:hypothetical protein
MGRFCVICRGEAEKKGDLIQCNDCHDRFHHECAQINLAKLRKEDEFKGVKRDLEIYISNWQCQSCEGQEKGSKKGTVLLA